MAQPITQANLIFQITSLMDRVRTLEIQNKKIYGNITIDGELGVLTIKNSSSETLVTIDQDGLNLFQTGASLGIGTNYYNLDLELVAQTEFGEGSGYSEFKTIVLDTIASGTRIIYNTLQISEADNDRLSFFQMNHSFTAGVFTSAGLDFSLDGQSASFRVVIDNADGSGFMMIPTRSSDPTGIFGGQMYYNTSTQKLKIFENPTWKTVTAV